MSSAGLTPSERSLIGAVAAHERWAHVSDRTAATAAARAALERKFLDQAGGDPARAANLRQAYYKRLALKSAQARRKAKATDAGTAQLGATA